MNNENIKSFVLISKLVLIEQFIKIIIYNFFMSAEVSLIPEVLIFRPLQNKNLSWLFNMADVIPPVAGMILIDLLGVVFFFGIHRYLVFFYGERERWFDIFRDTSYAGIMCAFIDVTVWGGSIDYIRIFDWFTFDLKDVYLSIGVGFIIIGVIKRRGTVDKEMEKQRGLLSWVRQGCPKCPALGEE